MSGTPTPAPTAASFEDWTEEEFEQEASTGGDEVEVEIVEEMGIEVEAAVVALAVTVANAPRLLI